MSRDRDDDRGRGRDDDRGRGRDRDDDRGRGRDRDDDRGSARGGRRDDGPRTQYVYKRRSEEQIKKHGERTGFGDPMLEGSVKWFRPADGETQFRILPPTYKDYEHYGMKVFSHNFVGANPSNYLCSEKMNTGKPCACCDIMRAMKKDGASKEELQDFQPKEGYLMYVIDRDVKSEEPMVYHATWSADKNIWEQTQSERTGETLYIDDPDQGYDVICKKSGKGKTGTKYIFSIARNSSPLMKSQQDQDRMMAYAEKNPFDELLKFYPYEHIEKNLAGSVPSSRDRDDDRGDDRGRGRDRDDDRRDTHRDDGRGRDRDDDSGRGRSRDNDDDERARGRGRTSDDDRGSDRDRERGRGERDDTRDTGDRQRDDGERGGTRERDADRGRDRDRGRDGPDADGERHSRDSRDRDGRDDRDDRDRGRDRDDDRGRGRDERDDPRGRSRY